MEGEEMKTGPRPAGDRWSSEDDRLLLALIDSKTTNTAIARKLKRSIPAINKRKRVLLKAREPQRSESGDD